MWISGRRRGGAKALADHLRRTDENESVNVRQIEGFAFDGLTGKNLEKALKQMEAIGYGKGNQRNFYHAILSPAYGESLNTAQQKFMVEYYVEHMGFKGYQHVLVEHWKKGKQHFHLVFNITDPATGVIDELKWTKTKEWRISRGLEQIFGLSTPTPKGKAAPVWSMQRGKRTGIDPRKMRQDITGIFNASATKEDFIVALDKAGYALTHGNRGQLVLVDKVGDTHGLMRMIEGKKLADLRQKFPDIEKMPLPSHANLVRARKSVKREEIPVTREPIDPQRIREDVQKAYNTSKTGAAFFAKLNRKEYALGRTYRGFAVIDKNGESYNLNKLLGAEAAKGLNKKFPDLAAIRPSYVSEIIRRIKASHKTGKRKSVTRSTSSIGGGGFAPVTQPAPASLPVKSLFRHAAYAVTHRQKQELTPHRPMVRKEGWPEAAVLDWKVWGFKAPRRFFTKWPELSA